MPFADLYQQTQVRLDPNPLINQMMQEDLRFASQQYASTYAPAPLYMKVPPDWYATTVACYCKEIPERLKDYYHQLVDYHRQAKSYERVECEKLCCVLKKLRVKY